LPDLSHRNSFVAQFSRLREAPQTDRFFHQPRLKASLTKRRTISAGFGYSPGASSTRNRPLDAFDAATGRD